MISVAEARAAMLALVSPLPEEDCALGEAFGRVLAQDVIARGAQPPFDASAMDGWAVRAADSPGRLRIAGESAAGRAYSGALKPGEAVRIFTGAPVPDGADRVIIQEEAKAEGGFVEVGAAGGANIRRQGLDFAAGDALLRAGARLDGVALSLAAAAGCDPVRVARAPRVAILAVGDELARPGGPLGADQIFESVSFGLTGLAAQWGAAARKIEAAGDTVEAIVSRLRPYTEQTDLLVTIGGASVGDYDLVKPAVQALGGAVAVENVAVRPGKPTWFARIGATLVLGLPGNPASALACAHLFLWPILERMAGRPGDIAFIRAALDGPLPANGPREHYVRARLFHDEQGRARVGAFEAQDSSLLSVFQSADALIRLPPKTAALAAGELVDVLELRRL